MFTDSHCHIYKEDYNNIDEIINNAKQVNITKMINNGTDYKSDIEVLELKEKYPTLYPAIGFHPEFASTYKKEELSIIEKNINKIVAIGEIGLDYHYEDSQKNKQKELLELQLDLAQKYNKPVIIHSRDATEDTINILKKYPTVKGVIHCFSGSYETACIYIKMGYKIGIGGVLTFKNAKLAEVVEKLPLESILVETDSPYLAPVPHRGEKNEPALMINTIKKICEIKKISIEKLSKITEKNVKEIFDI